MALTTTARFVRHVIAAGAASKPFDFQVDTPGDVRARFITALAPDPAWLVFGVDFTVKLNVTSTGGTVTFTPALVGAGTVEIERKTAPTQQRRFRNVARLPTEAIEGGFDQAMMALQDQAEELGRAITVPRGVAIDPSAAAVAAGTVPRLNDAGTAIEWVALLADVIASLVLVPVVTAPTLPAAQIAFGVREVLAGPRTYFVRADGSDSNDGQANTAGGAFKTLQKAIDVCQNKLDLNGSDVTINAEGVTYTGGVIVNGPWIGGGDVTLVMGAGGLIDTTDAHGVLVWKGGRLKLNFTGGGKIQTAKTGGPDCHGVYAIGGEIAATAISFGAVAGSKWQASGGGITLFGDHTSTGNAVSEFHGAGGGIHCNTGTYTLTGTPAYSAYFIGTSNRGGVNVANLTFSGAATGKRFICHKFSVIDAGSKARTAIPGDVAGQTANGGRFVGAANDVESFRAHHSTTQTINGAVTAVAFDTEDFDSNAIFASNAATPPAGLWSFNAGVAVTGATANGSLTVAIKKGINQISVNAQRLDAGGAGMCQVSALDLAGGAGVYTVEALVTGGGTGSAATSQTFFQGVGH